MESERGREERQQRKPHAFHVRIDFSTGRKHKISSAIFVQHKRMFSAVRVHASVLSKVNIYELSRTSDNVSAKEIFNYIRHLATIEITSFREELGEQRYFHHTNNSDGNLNFKWNYRPNVRSPFKNSVLLEEFNLICSHFMQSIGFTLNSVCFVFDLIFFHN